MPLVFLGDIHNEENAITESLADSNINLNNQNYAVFIEEIMENVADALIPPNQYADSIDIICEELPENAPDRLTLLNLMNNSNNNVYSFDGEGAPQSLVRHNIQRANINQLLGVNNIAVLDFVIVIDGIGHLEQNPDVQGWIPLQNVPPNYPNFNDIIVGLPNE